MTCEEYEVNLPFLAGRENYAQQFKVQRAKFKVELDSLIVVKF
jgi:hypothetical protein